MRQPRMKIDYLRIDGKDVTFPVGMTVTSRNEITAIQVDEKIVHPGWLDARVEISINGQVMERQVMSINRVQLHGRGPVQVEIEF